MGIEIVEKSGRSLTIKVSGKLLASEFRIAQKAAIDIIRAQDNVRVLVIGENFQGWDKSNDWNDVPFQLKYDEHIEKIAIVGAKEWEDLVLAFVGKGLRRVAIRFFLPSELAKAHVWLA